MVSMDHFAHELNLRLRNAAEQGATTILITSVELCKSIRGSGQSTQACREAMQAEVKLGDDVLVDQDSGSGMSVRYQLPRN
jgi:hypothetical protein